MISPLTSNIIATTKPHTLQHLNLHQPSTHMYTQSPHHHDCILLPHFPLCLRHIQRTLTAPCCSLQPLHLQNLHFTQLCSPRPGESANLLSFSSTFDPVLNDIHLLWQSLSFNRILCSFPTLSFIHLCNSLYFQHEQHSTLRTALYTRQMRHSKSFIITDTNYLQATL